MTEINLNSISSNTPLTITDGIFKSLYEAIVSLSLLPGSKISEADVAKQMNVSRQPVRDAFFRLSNLGLIQIRPQRATVVTKISPSAVFEAQYIRAAIEIKTVRVASENFTTAEIEPLDSLIEKQREAVAVSDKPLFQALDDEFHKTIFIGANKAFAWKLVKDNKAHMDRVRFLSLEFGANSAFEDHVAILDAIKERKADLADKIMAEHLGRIDVILKEAMAEHRDLFQ